MTLRELIQEQAGEEKTGRFSNVFGFARRDIAAQLKRTMIQVSGDREYVNDLFKNHIKVLSEEKYSSFASRNGIESLSVFNTNFGVEPVISEVLGDWGNEKEVDFLDDFSGIR